MRLVSRYGSVCDSIAQFVFVCTFWSVMIYCSCGSTFLNTESNGRDNNNNTLWKQRESKTKRVEEYVCMYTWLPCSQRGLPECAKCGIFVVYFYEVIVMNKNNIKMYLLIRYLLKFICYNVKINFCMHTPSAVHGKHGVCSRISRAHVSADERPLLERESHPQW